MKSWHTGDVEDLDVVDASTARTDRQNVENDTKMTKNMRRIIRMRRVKPRTQYLPLRHEFETSRIPDDGTTSAKKGTVHTHQKNCWLLKQYLHAQGKCYIQLTCCWVVVIVLAKGDGGGCWSRALFFCWSRAVLLYKCRALLYTNNVTCDLWHWLSITSTLLEDDY